MYTFAILVLTGLGVLAVSKFAARFLSMIHEALAVTMVGLGIGAAWLANFDMFKAWGMAARYDWVGLLITGVAIAGVGYFFHQVLGFFGSLHRKFSDEAATMERQEHLRRVA